MRHARLNPSARATAGAAATRAISLLAATALVAAAFIAVPTATPALATTCTDPGQGARYGGGSGEAADPYRIATVAHLQALRDRVNENVSDTNQSGCHFLQVASLDLGGIASWVPIGATNNTNTRFVGVYDGGFHRISNLTISGADPDPSRNRYGLFGIVRDGEVRNVRLVGVDIDIDFSFVGRDLYVGGLVGDAESSSGTPPPPTTVSASSVQGSISVRYASDEDVYVGGIVGRSQRGVEVKDRLVFRGSITGDVQAVDSSGSKEFNFGGLVGRTSSTSQLSLGYADATISVTVRAKDGGSDAATLVGILTGSSSNNPSNISELYAVGSIAITNQSTGTAFVGPIGRIENEDDAFTDIYFRDDVVAGKYVGAAAFEPVTTSNGLAGDAVAGWDTTGGRLVNVLARTDAQMRLDDPATTMTGTGGRWIYNNDPAGANPSGAWFLVLEPAPGEYPYPVFLWEIEARALDVPGGPSVPSGPVLACTPADPPVGSTVTCTVTGGDPDIDILWRAMAGEIAFASTGVRLGADGTGTFSFVVPRSALGLRIAVELVEWTRPLDVGVAGGPVPTGVAAGEGTPFSPAIVLLVGVLGLATVVSGLLAPRSRRTS